MDTYELININIMLGVYTLYLFNIKNMQNYNMFYSFLLFMVISFYFIYNKFYILSGIIFLLSIIHQPNYTIFFDLGLIMIILANLYNYNQLFDIYNIGVIIGIQYSILYLTNIIFKKHIIKKFPMIEIYTRSIIGSNILSWGLFTMSLLFIYTSLHIKNILGYFIIFTQILFNPSNPDKQFRSVPNQVITLIMEIYSKFKEELGNYKKELEINYKSYIVSGNIINKTTELVSKPKYKLELGDQIILPKDSIVPATLFLTSDSNIYISTIQIDGEKNLKLKRNLDQSDIYSFINNQVKNDYVYNDLTNIIRKNAIIKSDKAQGIIVNINHQNIMIPKLFELDKIIRNIELKYVYVTLILFGFNFIFGSLFNDISLFNTINYFMGIQMINPMSISSIIFIILSNISKPYVNYNGKKQMAAALNGKKLIHCSDKTGTLTSNKFHYHQSIFNPKADKSKLKEYIIRCSTNTMIDTNIIPEEEEYFRKLNIKYTGYEKQNDFIIKNNLYKQLFIGFIDHFKASFNLNIEKVHINHTNKSGKLTESKSSKYYVYLLVQCGEEFAMKFNQDNLIPNLPQIYEHCSSSNINIGTGAPRIWYILKSNKIIIEESKLNLMVEQYNANKNDKKKLIELMEQLMSMFIIEYYSAQIMTDEYRENVRDMIKFNKKNSIPFWIITGDNFNASKRISEDLFGSTHASNHVVYLDKNQQLDFINGKLLVDFNSNSIVCYSSESNIKGEIIKKLKQDLEYRVVYTGDGKNDVMALDNADISISFRDNNNEIDNELALVSGLIADSKFWGYYVDKLFNDGIEIRNKLSKGINLLMLKQSSVTGLMIGYYLNSNNLYKNLSEPFDGKIYMGFQILSFLIVVGVLGIKPKEDHLMIVSKLVWISCKNILFNICISWFNLPYAFYFMINLAIMEYYLIKY